jgi:3-hydroxybutyryl-CoA dehydrogenase
MASEGIKVGIIGAGAMGSGIAQVAATAGNGVKIFDSNPAAIEKATQNLQSVIEKLVEKGKVTSEMGVSIVTRITWIDNLEKFSDCDLLIEAIVENLDAKQKIFSELEKIVSDNCILGTNTSSLSVTSIASACSKPERLIGIHFFNPAPLMPLVEIIKGLATTAHVEEKTRAIIDGWNKVTVLAKDTPGFIVNRIARPYYGEAIRMYEEGLADFFTIDEAMKARGFKMGPFELMDLIGNDINYAVTETVWQQLFYDPRYKPSLTQKRLFEAKRFGRKSGKGYYDYIGQEAQNKPVVGGKNLTEISDRIIAMLINEAVDALYLNIATKEDLDLAVTKGVNYPKGLLKWCDEIGAEKILNALHNLLEEYNEERYRPSVLLKRMVKEKRKFYE